MASADRPYKPEFARTCSAETPCCAAASVTRLRSSFITWMLIESRAPAGISVETSQPFRMLANQSVPVRLAQRLPPLLDLFGGGAGRRHRHGLASGGTSTQSSA